MTSIKNNSTKSSYDTIKDQTLMQLSEANTKIENVDLENSPIGDIVNKTDTISNNIQNIISTLPQIVCSPGTICHNNKTKNDLKAKYYHAKETSKHAPENLRQAKKNYYTFLDGKQGWTKMERAKYHKKAIAEKQLIETSHTNKIKQLRSDIQSYSNILDYYKQLNIYSSQQSKHSNKQAAYLKNIKDNNALNKRKISYEIEQTNNMNIWKHIVCAIYIVIVLLYTYFFIKKKLWKQGGYRNSTVDILLLLFFYIWPFIAIPITKLVFVCIHFILGFIPMDVYSKLNYSS